MEKGIANVSKCHMLVLDEVSWTLGSLVPKALGGEGESDPGIHCLRVIIPAKHS